MVNYYVYDAKKFKCLIDARDENQAFNADALIDIKNDLEVQKMVEFLSR